MIDKIGTRIHLEYKLDNRPKSAFKQPRPVSAVQQGLQQANSLKNYQKYQNIWEKQKTFLNSKVDRNQSILDVSDNYLEKSAHKRTMSAVQ
jgi:hypothetical protein